MRSMMRGQNSPKVGAALGSSAAAKQENGLEVLTRRSRCCPVLAWASRAISPISECSRCARALASADESLLRPMEGILFLLLLLRIPRAKAPRTQSRTNNRPTTDLMAKRGQEMKRRHEHGRKRYERIQLIFSPKIHIHIKTVFRDHD